jgi:hypothetical protein
MLPRRLRGLSSWTGGSFAGVLGALEAELASDLVLQGAVLGSQAGDLGSGGVESLAK